VEVSNGPTGAGYRVVIVGWYFDRAGSARGFLYSQGNYSTIDVPGAGSAGTFVYGMDAAGAIVGQYYDQANVTHGFIYRNARFTIVDDPHGGVGSGEGTSLDAISPDGTIAGVTTTTTLSTMDSPTGTGYLQRSTTRGQGRRRAKEPRRLPSTTRVSLAARTRTPPGAAHGFILAHGSYVTVDVPGAVGTEVLGLNDAGDVVGASVRSDGDVRGFFYQPY